MLRKKGINQNHQEKAELIIQLIIQGFREIRPKIKTLKLLAFLP